jgi:hypothetical protein
MSEGCNVSLGEWDGDVDDYEEIVVKSRRERTCHECREVIPAGTDHELCIGRYDGEWQRYRFCLPCSEIQKEFCEHGRVFGSTWEEFRDQWNGGANLQACLNRVSSVAAKAKLRDQWQKFKRLS